MSLPTTDDDFVPDPGMVSASPRALWVPAHAGVEFFRKGPASTCARVDHGMVCGKTIETGFICEHHVALLVPRLPRVQVLAEAKARYLAFLGNPS